MVMKDGTPIARVDESYLDSMQEKTRSEYKYLGEVTEIKIEEKTRGQLMGDLDSLVENWEAVISQVDSLSEKIHQVRGELGSRFGIHIALDKFDVKSPILGKAVPVVPGIVIMDPEVVEGSTGDIGSADNYVVSSTSDINTIIVEDVNLEVPVNVPIDTRTASQIRQESLEMGSAEAQMEERQFTNDMEGRFSGILESAFKIPVAEFTPTSDGKVVTRGYR